MQLLPGRHFLGQDRASWVMRVAEGSKSLASVEGRGKREDGWLIEARDKALRYFSYTDWMVSRRNPGTEQGLQSCGRPPHIGPCTLITSRKIRYHVRVMRSVERGG